MKLNAPKQGFFATILAVSFLLHSIIMMQNSLVYQDTARKSQANLLLDQLSTAVQLYLPTKDTVSIALLVNEYSSQGLLSDLKIYAADNTLLGEGGNTPLRFGLTFDRQVMLNNKLLGHIEITMHRLNPGEVMRHQWPYFLFILFIHMVLWFIYRSAARPESSQINYQTAQMLLAQQAADNNLPAPILQETPAVTAAALEETQNSMSPNVSEPHTTPNYKVVVKFAYSDPSQLLETLSQGVAKSYYTLSQTLLEQAIAALNINQHSEFVSHHVITPFAQQGAVIGINGRTADAVNLR